MVVTSENKNQKGHDPKQPFIGNKARIFLSILAFPILAVPLMASGKFVDSLVTPKEFYFLFYTSSLLLIFLIYWLFAKEKFQISFNFIDIAIGAFYLYCLSRIVFSNSSQLRGSSFQILTGMFFIYIFLRFLLSGDSPLFQLRVIISGLLCFSFVQVLYGYLQLWDFASPAMINFKVGGSFGNPGPFSNYIVSVLPMAMGVALFWPKDNKFDIFLNKIGYWLTILTLLILPATKARTAWIAAIVGVVFVLWQYDPLKSLFKKIFTNLISKLTIILGGILLLSITGYYLYQFKQQSASGRIFTWEITSEIIADKPLLGSGYNSFQVTHNDYQAAYFERKGDNIPETKLADNTSFAFNEFLQVTSELGIIGLLLFSGIFLCLFIRQKKKLGNDVNHIRSFVVASIIAILVCSLSSYPFHDIPAFLNLFVLLAIAASFQQNTFSVKSIKKRYYAIPIIFMALGIIWHITILKERFDAHQDWTETTKIVRERNKEAMESYNKLYPVLHYSGYFLFNYGAELSLANNHSKAIEILKEAMPLLNDGDVYTYLGNSYENSGDMEMAEKSFLQAHYIVPQKLYPLYRLVYIYAKVGKMEVANELAQKIIRMDVKVESKVTQDIKLEMANFINNQSIKETK